MRGLGRRVLAMALSLVLVATASPQDLTHPLDMDLPASRFERPDPSDYTVTLDNGLVAYVAQADQVPMVTLSAFIRTGTVRDRVAGSAEALQAALRQGPAKAPGEAFAESLRQMTARYTVEMHAEWTEVSLNVPVEDLDQAIALFADVIIEPAISDSALASAGRAAAAASADLAGEDGPALYEGSMSAAVDRFHEILYQDHPYGDKPSVEDFQALGVGDVRAFHQAFFVPANMVLAVAGDIEPADIAGRLEALFGGMTSRPVEAPRRSPPLKARQGAQHDFPADKLQTWLVFGHGLPMPPFGDPGALDERAALEVMNYMLAGGHLWTRMTIETRYKYGYTNDASGFLEEHWYGPGSYTFRTYSRHDVIDDIYRNMMDEVMRIRSEPVTNEELFVAKGALTEGSFPVQYLDGYTLVRTFALERLRYRDHSRSASYVERIRAVTADDVLAAAKKYLRPEDMQVVLVGQPVELIPPGRSPGIIRQDRRP